MLQDAFEEVTWRVWRDLSVVPDEEIRVSANVDVTLTWADRVDLKDLKSTSMPAKAGIYVVYSGGRPHYVGITYRPSGLQARWKGRRAVLRELDLLHPTTLGNRYVIWATAVARRLGSGGQIARLPNKGPIGILEGALRAIELYLIFALRTRTRGNLGKEPLRFTGGHRLIVNHVNFPKAPADIQRAFGNQPRTTLNLGLP